MTGSFKHVYVHPFLGAKISNLAHIKLLSHCYVLQNQH